MNINIQTIPQKKHRYITAGDWIFNQLGDLNIKVSDLGNEDMELMVGLHECIESWLCRKRGIKEEDVTAFDTSEYGMKLDDPGSDLSAPYHKEHMIALQIERILAYELKVNWEEYEKRLLEVCV